MVIFSDGIKIEMQWKQVTYFKKNDYVSFEIIPMVEEKDIVVIPNHINWITLQDVFSGEERHNIISLLESVTWKRDIQIVELDISPCVNRQKDIEIGMREATTGYIELTKENLFDADSRLDKNQVKKIFCKLEERFAECASGIVKIPQEILLKGSVIKEVCIPALSKNKNVKLIIS